ncbi:MAG TPA: sigma-70 family RNA polymerase sigma factor [Chitinophagaceae bacterium]|nr:sigma-70 family RNA polymerase sigma factor [Chitinophagaceae bacterium]
MKTDFSGRNLESYAPAFQQGDMEGIKILFTTWYTPLCAYIDSLIQHKAVSEEIASEAFVKTWHHRQQLSSVNAIRAYLFTIAKRDAFRWQQWQQKNRAISLPDQLPAIQEPDHHSCMVRIETLRLLHKAIRELPPRCRQVFQLLYVQGKKTAEVAKELAISPYTVRAQKARGLNLLRPRLLSFFADQ